MISSMPKSRNDAMLQKNVMRLQPQTGKFRIHEKHEMMRSLTC